MKRSKIVVVLATVFAFVGGSLAFSPAVSAEGDCFVAVPDQPAVVISGGTVTNSTTIDLNADAGTAISDASGADYGIAVVTGGDEFGDVASAGNAGTATSSANGGAISVGNVNSGGNVGNLIEVGDTFACPPPPEKKAPAPEKKEAAPEKAPKAEKAPKERVAALPDTGVGLVGGEVNYGFIALALVGAVAAAGYSVRRIRFN